MTKILFICLGNICRSPMAEFVMKDLVEKAGLADEFQIDSAATCRDEIGNPVYPPARRKLAEHGISCEGHAACHRHGGREPQKHAAHLRRRPGGEDAPAARLHRPPGRRRRPVVYRRF